MLRAGAKGRHAAIVRALDVPVLFDGTDIPEDLDERAPPAWTIQAEQAYSRIDELSRYNLTDRSRAGQEPYAA